MSDSPAATVVIPTRDRPDYLAAALDSIAGQARTAGCDVIVVCDGADPVSARVAAQHGAEVLVLPGRRGANAARNAAVAATAAPIVVFTDDDVIVPDGWLDALLDGAAAYPDHDVFGGPIRPLLQGGGPRHCGREPAPITNLDLGPADCDAEFVWSANLAVRRRTLAAVGPFDEGLEGRGEEEEWQRRHLAAGGRTRYLAAAGVVHHRSARDARGRALSAAAYALGRTARRNDVSKQCPPTLRGELRGLAGAVWHAVRRRCAYGIVFAAHACGRIMETLDPIPIPPAEPFLSGESGHVGGMRGTALARIADARADAGRLLSGRRLRRDAAAWGTQRRVLVLAIERTDMPNLLSEAERELRASHHEVTFVRAEVGGRGKFENLQIMLDAHPPESYDWIVVLDDDVTLPRGFLDTFLFLAERHGLALAQPAHRRYSHAAWRVTRRRRGSAVRETRFVEIGPVTALHRTTFDTLLPFPPLRAGWGLDAHWAAVAKERGWRTGVVDATAVQHALRPIAATYDASAAIAEATDFLSGRPHVDNSEAQQTVRTHRGW